MFTEFDKIRALVQHNCDVSDARHAGNFTLCTYLLKMREFYRWEQHLPFSTTLAKDAIGQWLKAREQHWETLEEQDYCPYPLAGTPADTPVDPFDSVTLNHYLTPHQLVYSGGYGRHCKPHFFLADLREQQQRDGFSIYIADREYARDLSAPPAMTLGETIFVRRESLRRMLWEKVEEWQWKKLDNPMQKAIASYDFNESTEAALDAMTENELESVILHELGEAKAGKVLGTSWQKMILALVHSKAELMAAAVRDHLADCICTIPSLIEKQHSAALHFYFGNFRAMRRELFPSLVQAYQLWVTQGNWDALQRCANQGKQHWAEVAQALLTLYKKDNEDFPAQANLLIEGNRL